MKLLKYIFALIFLLSTVQAKNIVKLKLDKNKYEAVAGRTFEVKIKTKLKEHWHINTNKPKAKNIIATSLKTASNEFEIVDVKYPPTKPFKLPHAPAPVEVMEGEFDIVVTVKAKSTLKNEVYKLPLKLRYQACNETTCKPPKTKKLIATVNVAIGEEIFSDESKDPKSELSKTEQTNPANDGESQSILMALLFAFIGGMILNLMPCVLPVLSLKIMGIVQQAGESQKEKVKHGLLFTVGVLISFWALAGLLLLLRAGGEQLGWGFQLQSPEFVIVLIMMLFLFGLSLFGVFEIGTSLTSVGQSNNRSAYFGSLMSGIMATVVATPCTAPFMGSALGFAISQPAVISLLIFTFLGLGMAAPYLLLTASPKLLKFVPKPGNWMETMKEFMGFLLIATVLWLLWVLSLQTGASGVLFVLAALIIVSIGGWIYGKWGNISKKKTTRRIAQILFVIFLIVGFGFAFNNVEKQSVSVDGTEKQGLLTWEKFSPEKVKQYRSENRPVLLDFTAAWCLSCQVNEKVAFGNTEVQEKLIELNVATLKGDWTNNDEVITKALAEFNRTSVPLYVLYVSGKKPILLPEIITPEIVLDALKNIK